MSKKERLVASIENGTVIDHIPSEKTYEVANLLRLQDLKAIVTIGCQTTATGSQVGVLIGTKEQIEYTILLGSYAKKSAHVILLTKKK